MPTNGIMYKRLYTLGIGAYVIMLIFSILFYKERTIFPDASFTMFRIIKDGHFCIQHYRFGDVCSQIFSVLAVKLGLPIISILISYSAGFVAFYFFTYVVCGRILKRYDLALVILLMNILFVSDSFYFIQSQLAEAAAMAVLVFAMVAGKQLNNLGIVRWIFLLALEATIVFLHPLTLFVLLFAVIFFLITGLLRTDNKLLYGIVVIYIAGAVIKLLFFKDPYETHSASGLKNFVTQFPNYFTLFSNRRFLVACITKYYWMPVLFFLIAILYIRSRQWKPFIFLVSFFMGYLLLVNISYPGRETPFFYIENMYLPLSTFLALPFVFDILPLLDSKKLAMPAMILIVCTGCARMYASHDVSSARLNLERRYLDKYEGRKVIVKASAADIDTLQMLWGTAYETLLLSESERGKPASVIIDEDPSRMPWPVSEKRKLLVNWDTFPYKDLNPGYFQFNDTVSAYSIIDP